MSGAGGQQPAFCPHCGYDLTRLEAVEDGPFSYDVRSGFAVDGTRLTAAPQVHMMLGALILSRGAIVTRSVIAERMGYEGDNASSLIGSLLTQARYAIVQAGHPFPVQTEWGSGIKWCRETTPHRGTKYQHRERSLAAQVSA